MMLFTSAESRKRAFTAASLLCLAGAFALALYYIWGPSRVEFHSDFTDTLMWAEASYTSGRVFSPTFSYAALLPFGGQLLMLPFIGITGVSMTTHALGMSLFLCALTAALFFFFCSMRWSAGASALASAAVLLAAQLSPKLREMFYGHIIYYSLGILFLLVGLALTFRILENGSADGRPKGKVAAWAVLSIWVVLCSTDGFTALTLFTLPVVSALLAERFFDTRTKLGARENRVAYRLAILILAASVLGWGLGKWMAGSLTAEYANMFSAFSSPDTWAANLMKFVAHWPTLLGADGTGGSAIASLNGISAAMRIALSLLLLALPIAALFVYRKLDSRADRVVVIAHWAVAAFILFGYTFGQLHWANWRLAPLVVTSLMVCFVMIRWLWKNVKFKRLGAALAAPLAVVLLMGAVEAAALPNNPETGSQYYRIGRYLERNGFTYGYASFWNANVVTVVTDSKVKVREVVITEDSYMPRRYQCDSRWYLDQPGQRQYFLLLTGDEYNEAIKNKNPILNGSVRTLWFDTYAILVYDENLFH